MLRYPVAPVCLNLYKQYVIIEVIPIAEISVDKDNPNIDTFSETLSQKLST